MKQERILRRLGCALMLSSISINAQAQSLQLSGSSHQALFAGHPSPYEITISGVPDSSLMLRWELSTHGRLLDRGKEVLRLDGRGHSTSHLTIEAPPLKRGFQLGASLTIVIDDDSLNSSPGRFQQDLILYGPAPLAMHADRYRHMKIKLLDPDGDTASMLKNAGVPFARVKRGRLAELPQGELIIIAAGMLLEQQGDRGAWLHELAAGGHQVVVLQPAGGALLLSPAGTGLLAQITDIHMAHMPRWLLPLYPAAKYTADITRRLAIYQHRDQTLVEVTDGGSARFSWLMLEYGYGKGRLAMITWPLHVDFKHRPLKQLDLGHLLDYFHSLYNPPHSRN